MEKVYPSQHWTAMIDSTDVFVSYQAADREWAEWIAHVLEDAGQRVKLQAWDVPAGTDFVQWMSKHLTVATKTVAVYSDAYFASRWCTDEWTAALRRQNLVPLRVAPVEPPLLLAALAYVDLFGVPEEIARERLLIAAGVRTVRRAAVAGFPGVRREPTPADPGRSRPPGGAAVSLSTAYSFSRTPSAVVFALRTSADGRHFGVVDSSRRLWLFAVDEPTRLTRVKVDPTWLDSGNAFLEIPSADLVVTGSGKVLRFFRVPDGKLVHEVVLGSRITGLTAAGNAGWVAVSTVGGPGLAVFSTTTYNTVTSPAFAPATRWALDIGKPVVVRVSGDGNVLFAAAGRSLVRWDLTTGEQDRWTSAGSISHIATSENGGRFATRSSLNTPVGVYEMWTANGSGPIGHVEDTSLFNDIDLDPSGLLVALANGRGVRLLRHDDQEVVATVAEKNAAVAFTDQGRHLITAGGPTFRAKAVRRHTLTYLYD